MHSGLMMVSFESLDPTGPGPELLSYMNQQNIFRLLLETKEEKKSPSQKTTYAISEKLLTYYVFKFDITMSGGIIIPILFRTRWKKNLRYFCGIPYCLPKQVNRYIRVKGNRGSFRGNLKVVYWSFHNIIGKDGLGFLTWCLMLTLWLRFSRRICLWH